MGTKVYVWHDELGEQACVILKSTGQKFKLSNLCEGDIIEFYGQKEVVIKGEDNPPCIHTIRRAGDGVGIELSIYSKINLEGRSCHTIEGKDDALDQFLFKGKGYENLNRLLEKHNM